MKSLREKLLLTFILFSIIMVGALVLISSIYNGQKEDVLSIRKKTLDLKVLLLEDLRAQREYFIYDTRSNKYFETEESVHIRKHNQLNVEIRNSINSIQGLERAGEFGIRAELHSLKNNLDKMNEKFDRLEQMVLKRGFHDYGLEGQMRELAHDLEDRTEVPREDVLQMRRHEKDYIIRHDTTYIRKFLTLSRRISRELMADETISIRDRKEVADLIDRYGMEFLQLTELESKLGLKDHSGLKQELDVDARSVLVMADQLISKAQERESVIMADLQLNFAILIALFIIGNGILSYFLTNRITRPLRELSKSISNFVDSGFAVPSGLKNSTAKDEIGVLNNNVLEMEEEIISFAYEFREKVKMRTRQVERAKLKIEQQRDKIMKQRDQLSEQKQLLEAQNKSFMDSLIYAKRIQDALLKSENALNDIMPEHFVFFQPKDIVSGE